MNAAPRRTGAKKGLVILGEEEEEEGDDDSPCSLVSRLCS